MRNAILWYAIQYGGNWNRIAQAICDHEPYKCVEYNYPFITYGEQNYPKAFYKLRYPPWILFYQGNLDLLESKGIGIIGARNCSQQALINTKTVVDTLKDEYTIISGLAKGIDAQAHRCCLDKNTIGFIGCGIDRVYPKENYDLFQKMAISQLIMSEYPCQVPPNRWHFPWRNRLIAACSDAMIVIEATTKSGTLHTVDECNTLGIPVYCLPTAFENQNYPGCNYLIENGAEMIADKNDLVQIFQLTN